VPGTVPGDRDEGAQKHYNTDGYEKSEDGNKTSVELTCRSRSMVDIIRESKNNHTESKYEYEDLL
jgi:hypothetical protein